MASDVTGIRITRRSRTYWRKEYALAQHIRPQSRGGLGWLRPLHPRFFRYSPGKILDNLINFRSVERLMIREADDADEVAASLWIERGFGTNTRLTLLAHPRYTGLYDEALISYAIRRYGGEPLVIEHPYDETVTNALLERYRFYRHRSVYHMRWDSQ